jgi:hypothetical protein
MIGFLGLQYVILIYFNHTVLLSCDTYVHILYVWTWAHEHMSRCVFLRENRSRLNRENSVSSVPHSRRHPPSLHSRYADLTGKIVGLSTRKTLQYCSVCPSWGPLFFLHSLCWWTVDTQSNLCAQNYTHTVYSINDHWCYLKITPDARSIGLLNIV